MPVSFKDKIEVCNNNIDSYPKLKKYFLIPVYAEFAIVKEHLGLVIQKTIAKRHKTTTQWGLVRVDEDSLAPSTSGEATSRFEPVTSGSRGQCYLSYLTCSKKMQHEMGSKFAEC